MRMQIFLRDDLAEVLNELAWEENRFPKQQAEWLLQQALEKVARQFPPQEQEAALVHGVGSGSDTSDDA